MRIKVLILSILGLGIAAIAVWAKTENPTSVAFPVVLYGTFNGNLVPIQITSDGSLVLQ